MSDERARDLGLAHVLRQGRDRTAQRLSRRSGDVRGGWLVDRDELYAQAGVQPDDIDFVQTYDDYPVIVMMQFEDLGFCDKGEGPGLRACRTR